MGRKRIEYRKHILLCIAGLIFFSLVSCASVEHTLEDLELYKQVRQGHHMLADDDFQAVIDNSLAILELNATIPPADAALFNLGLVYAHVEYYGKDYNKSLNYFAQLRQRFPKSPLSEEAKIWIDLFGGIKASEQKFIEELRERDEQPIQIIIPEPEVQVELGHQREYLFVGNIEAALDKNHAILAKETGPPLEDTALYQLGLLYAHNENSKKDYKKSVLFMRRLVDEFPDSLFVYEAQIWLSLFELIENMQQVDLEIEEKKKEFTQ